MVRVVDSEIVDEESDTEIAKDKARAARAAAAMKDPPHPHQPADLVFICYRQKDLSHFADQLAEQLEAAIGADRVFLDAAIEPGRLWRSQIDAAIRRSAVMLVLIGESWLRTTGPDGTYLLGQPDDVLTSEIADALGRGDSICVIPVLVGTTMPRKDELPDRIRGLFERQAMTVNRRPRSGFDRARLVERVATELAWRTADAL